MMDTAVFNAEALYASLSAFAEEYSLSGLAAALPFAREKHAGQKRKGAGDVPYIVHPLIMASQAVALGLHDDDLLSAVLCHDVCEDCGVLPSELPVSDRAREAVARLTYPEGVSREEIDPIYYAAIGEDDIASFIKCLDRTHNLSGMALCFTPERMRFYLTETETFVFPLLARLERSRPDWAGAVFQLRYQMVTLYNTIAALLG